MFSSFVPSLNPTCTLLVPLNACYSCSLADGKKTQQLYRMLSLDYLQ
jgi:hypothetical protein